MPWPLRLAVIAAFLSLAACQLAPTKNAGLQRSVLDAEPFRLALIEPHRDDPAFAALRIVLIDGDGRAFLSRTRVAADPTPQRSWLRAQTGPLQSVASTVFLGRPCYWRVSDPACDPRFWTTHRYGRKVRQSLFAALTSLSADGVRLMLVGYSGGGYLASRLALQLPASVKGLVTVAAPLDPNAWAAHHGYTPLVDAEAIDVLDLPLATQCQRHLVGSEDEEVPPALSRDWLQPLPETMRVVAAGHECCWTTELRRVIEQLAEECFASGPAAGASWSGQPQSAKF